MVAGLQGADPGVLDVPDPEPGELRAHSGGDVDGGGPQEVSAAASGSTAATSSRIASGTS